MAGPKSFAQFLVNGEFVVSIFVPFLAGFDTFTDYVVYRSICFLAEATNSIFVVVGGQFYCLSNVFSLWVYECVLSFINFVNFVFCASVFPVSFSCLAHKTEMILNNRLKNTGEKKKKMKEKWK